MKLTHILISMAITFGAGALIGPVVIMLMRRLKASQTERDDGPKSHLKKQGTPTVGGLIFLIPIAAVALTYAFLTKTYGLVLPAVCMLAFGVIGFLDDLLKIVKRNKDGLRPWQKMGGLFVISLAAALWLYFKGGSDITVLYFDMFNWHASIDIKWGFIPYAVFVMLAATNAVNLTDGLDGLCGGSSAIVFTMFSCVAFSAPELFPDNGMQLSGFVCAAGLMAFLLYNYHPARIFMGDTGSLALGGGLAVLTLLSRRPFMLVIGGALFVIEALSDIIQVSVFKLSGRKKRVFKMAPIHHHFELCGWKELTVVWTFWLFTLACSIFTYFSII